MVAERLAETQSRIGELVALAAQLQDVSARLAAAPTGGFLWRRLPVHDGDDGAAAGRREPSSR